MSLDITKMTDDEIGEYKQEQKEVMRSYKVGANDLIGNKITRVLAKADDYIIYEVETDIIAESLRVQVYTVEPDDPNNLEVNFSEIKIPLNEVKSVLYKARRDNAFKNIIASAVAMGLVGKVKESADYLIKLKARIESEYKAQFSNKLTFLFSNLFVAIMLSIFSIFQSFGALSSHYSKESVIYAIVYVATFGSIGGFISVSLKLKNKIFETGVPNYMYFAYGLERSILSIIGAIVLYFMIMSNLVLGYIMELDNPVFTLLVFSAIAGFSENLIPDLLEKLERGIKVKE